MYVTHTLVAVCMGCDEMTELVGSAAVIETNYTFPNGDSGVVCGDCKETMSPEELWENVVEYEGQDG